jgi:CRISPR-associated protein Cas1
MQLYLDSYGVHLGVENGMFRLKPKNNAEQLIAVGKVKCIFVSKGASLSSDAVLLSLENAIPMIFTDFLGRSQGYIWSGQFGSVSTIRKKQALISSRPEGLEFIRQILIVRAERQVENLQIMTECKELEQVNIREDLQILQRQIKRWQNWIYKKSDSFDDIAASYRGMEGTATRHYFKAMMSLIPQKWNFEKREKRPAYDSFNALLNYLYGMLYPLVELSLIKSGLDPYMGILHTDRYNRPTMVYDCIEPYRHWAERVAVIELIAKNKLDENADFDCMDEKEGIRLSTKGKNIVIPTMLDFLDAREQFEGQMRKRTTHIDLDAQILASKIRVFDISSI